MIRRGVWRNAGRSGVLLLLAGCTASPAERGGLRVAFPQLVAELSEPGGYFDTDNLISNERSYLHVMGDLDARRVRGGAYIGVGPDQNFSYIARIRPAVAFIVDIRRDNLLEHLLFKALFALADTPREYLAVLLARPVPAGPPGETVDALLARLDATSPTAAATRAARHRTDSVIATFGVPLADGDRRTIDRFHRTFIAEGLDLRFRSHGRAPMWYYPTLRDLILETDLQGRQASYLASREAFTVVDALQEQDRVVPVVGDFAGDHALHAIAEHLRERGLAVSAFYTSNVEFYLIRGGSRGAFLKNLDALPRTDGSVIIRSVFRRPFDGAPVPTRPGYASVQEVEEIGALLQTNR